MKLTYNTKQKLISKVLLFVFVNVIITISLANTNPYQPKLELDTKLGIKRQFGRMGMLLPILQNQNCLLYQADFGMGDSNKNIEGNFGLGFRKLVNNNYILGTYGFWDIRKTSSKNLVDQITVGAEYLTKHFELRINGYFPQDKVFIMNVKDVNLEKVTYGHKEYKKMTMVGDYEIPLKGFDIEVGGSLYNLNKLCGFASFYHYNSSKTKPLFGLRVRSEFTLNQWLSFAGECSYDYRRRFTSYIGIKLQYSLGLKQKHNKLTLLQQKMTQLPVRDIDIVLAVESNAKLGEKFELIKDNSSKRGKAIKAIYVKTLNEIVDEKSRSQEWDRKKRQSIAREMRALKDVVSKAKSTLLAKENKRKKEVEEKKRQAERDKFKVTKQNLRKTNVDLEDIAAQRLADIYNKDNDAALKIQALYRDYAIREKNRKTVAAVRTIQRSWRGYKRRINDRMRDKLDLRRKAQWDSEWDLNSNSLKADITKDSVYSGHVTKLMICTKTRKGHFHVAITRIPQIEGYNWKDVIEDIIPEKQHAVMKTFREHLNGEGNLQWARVYNYDGFISLESEKDSKIFNEMYKRKQSAPEKRYIEYTYGLRDEAKKKIILPNKLKKTEELKQLEHDLHYSFHAYPLNQDQSAISKIDLFVH